MVDVDRMAFSPCGRMREIKMEDDGYYMWRKKVALLLINIGRKR